ncbi:glutamate-cysteine ligase family protein [Kribbella sp. CA-293567]|uniref:glutamate-cysteine ligase family protein n=1 Tax=Kribbella sp. CA-293567 TaxID=3002436 RepID=UPI0022DD8936|nr:glutamate-cysteine ligase family protein [Kribbella sp. CA-293567]WBQ03147.1 glutamate-cysteine ligase family protein [Kribbella sp. CA-293567]
MDTKELRPLAAGLLAGARRRTTRIAIEQEFLVADLATGAAVPIERVRRAVRFAHAAPYVGFEPGGQLELSLPCAADPAGALQAFTSDLQQHLSAAGIQLAAVPCDSRPEHEVPLQLTSPRYVAMHRHFDAIGPAGRRMMRRTASTQVCLDWWPGAAGAEQWRVLNLAGPFLAALFARSSGLGSRLATWLRADPARTGFDDRLLYGDPVTAYAEFAAGADVFVTGGPADHLTTLFPPVRPRGNYLEVRFLDAQEPANVGPVVTTFANLLYDDELRRRTLRHLEAELPHLADHWYAAAMGDPELTERARQLLPDLEPAA